MNCSQSQIAIRAAVYGDGVLDAATRAHLATCEECREDFADWTLDRSLEGQRLPTPRDGFLDEAIANAIRKGNAARNRRYAIAASIAAFGLALSLFFAVGNLSERGDSSGPRVVLVAHEGKVVRLVINSPTEQDAATVSIELADNLELAGFPNEHRIEWQTNLSEGKNLLALPLTLKDQADSHFRVQVHYGSTQKDIRVSVHGAPAGSEINQVKA
jgi:hypothetical protein